MLNARIKAVNYDARTFRHPSDGCSGAGQIYYIDADAIFEGEIENCRPSGGQFSVIVTSYGNTFRGKIEDEGQTMIGTFSMKNGSKISGTFSQFLLDGQYSVKYPDGRICEETWSDGYKYRSTGEDELC